MTRSYGLKDVIFLRVGALVFGVLLKAFNGAVPVGLSTWLSSAFADFAVLVGTVVSVSLVTLGKASSEDPLKRALKSRTDISATTALVFAVLLGPMFRLNPESHEPYWARSLSDWLIIGATAIFLGAYMRDYLSEPEESARARPPLPELPPEGRPDNPPSVVVDEQTPSLEIPKPKEPTDQAAAVPLVALPLSVPGYAGALVTLIFDQTARRLLKEIWSLGRRGNLNLVIGVMTTIAAIGVLIFMVTTATQVPDTLPAVLKFYIPRVTTVVFIEVFAYFFLRLYKGCIADIKYYQSELTTLSVYQCAFEISQIAPTPECTAQLVRAFAAVGRPPVPADGDGKSPEFKDLAGFIEQITKLAGKASGEAK